MMWRGSVSVICLCLCQTLTASNIADTKYGRISGISTKSNNVYYGVPYAKPPVGSLRWQAPQEPNSWGTGIYRATSVKPGCAQYHCAGPNPPMVCPKQTSEDCLYLNIWAPSGTNSTSSLAVMVYLHGGNFVYMSGGSLLYDGSILSQKGDVIVVNVDYRLGALGFLVTGDKAEDATGNYGILDQRLALQWVGENIKGFGGDPSRITLFGQSAGAQSAMIHLVSADSSQFFTNAIIESAPFSIPYKSYAEAVLLGSHLAKLVNCSARDMKCLHNRSSSDIAYAQYLSRKKISSLKLLEEFEPWGPYVDGKVVMTEPLKSFEKGHFQRKPIMVGTVSQECQLYIYSAWDKPVDKVLYTAIITATHPNHIIKIMKEYPAGTSKDERETMVALGTDYVFGCSSRHVSREMVKYGISDVWMYIYDHAFSFPGWGDITFCQGYVCHGSEVPFVFQSAGLGGFNYTADELVLSDQMIAYWSNFAKTGTPQGAAGPLKSLPEWPRFHPDDEWPFLHFQTPTSFVDKNYNRYLCDFWDQVKYNN